MTSGKRLALLGLPVVVALGGTFVSAGVGGSGNPQLRGDVTRAAPPATVRTLTGGPLLSDRRDTATDPFITSSETFVPVPFASVAVAGTVPPDSRRLFKVRFTAESACSETDGVGEPNWCKIRILIAGVEGYPQNEVHAPSTLAFDSTDNGTESANSWESHTTEGARCISNPTTSPRAVSVRVEAAVTNFGADADAPAFWLDDRTLDTSVYDGCTG